MTRTWIWKTDQTRQRQDKGQDMDRTRTKSKQRPDKDGTKTRQIQRQNRNKTKHPFHLFDNDFKQSVSHLKLAALELRHLSLSRGLSVLQRVDVVGDGIETRLVSGALLLLLQETRLQCVEAQQGNWVWGEVWKSMGQWEGEKPREEEKHVQCKKTHEIEDRVVMRDSEGRRVLEFAWGWGIWPCMTLWKGDQIG